jgi:hypothetical protein
MMCFCGQHLAVPVHSKGQEFPCPSCGQTLMVPENPTPALDELYEALTADADSPPVDPFRNVAPPPAIPRTDQHIHRDIVFLDKGPVTVTKTRLVLEGQTFPLLNISSVRKQRNAPSRKYPIVVALLGFFLVMTLQNPAVVMGFAILVGATFWMIQQKPIYAVAVGAAGGELQAYASTDEQSIDRIIAAVNEAIVARG